MSPRYIRTRPEKSDELTAALVAGALALGVGAVAFYVIRVLLAREPLDPHRPRDVAGAEASED